jgi:hypothetical protein
VTWADPSTDLRTLLSDGLEDKLRYRKKVFGEVDGNNVAFKTFEFRRITDFTSSDGPLGVWVDGVLGAAIDSDNPSTGDFFLKEAPSTRSKVEASYYIQWFTDVEITNFLRLASNWLALGDNFANISQGLRPAALKYAAAEAYQKLALRWADPMSQTFLLNDAPAKDAMKPIDEYQKLSLNLRKEAQAVRDDFYSRSGQNLQPLFGTAGGNASNPEPVR